MSDVHYEVVFFNGRVQGVGFRYATSQVAKEFDVAGSVANLPDGRVQVEVEGRTEEVNAFIEAVGDRMHGFIRKVERTAGRRAPQFRGFTIRS
ncbi:acylphosphatase [Horticoccus luteus]|uniref:acylphosphatase n=1 Tax=Horticoccus luteus TaxID=2862869 RepID=A0A8F9TYN2_9BACT|nr:acylphosphatase [Horticoccus luteus]QYM80638.1 acylphosphatase [Horticoccus luteus]